MGYSNYPDGMREGDIPGYWDVDCPDCGGDDEDCATCDGDGMVDSRESYEYDPDPEPDLDPYYDADVW